MSGKGSSPRPLSVDAQTFADNFARTFSRRIDDPSGYDAREKECPPLPPAQSPWADWPERDALPTTDPESAG